MDPLHLPRLRSLHHENPTKRISLIRLAWPDIEKALARGHSLKVLHARLLEDDLRISYSLLSLYVRRLQGKASRKRQPRSEATAGRIGHAAAVPGAETAGMTNANSCNRQQETPGGSIKAPPQRDRQIESLGGSPEQGSPPAPPKPPERPQRRGLMTPSELNALTANDDNEGCWFKEHVPDIKELFR